MKMKSLDLFNKNNIKKSLLIIFIILVIQTPDIKQFTNINLAAGEHSFSIIGWEFKYLPEKWIHKIWAQIPGNKPTFDEKRILIDEYLELTKSINISSQENKTIEKLNYDKEILRARVEQSIESAISETAKNENLDILWGFIFPPVDIKLGPPPGIIVTSLKDELKLTNSKIVTGQLSSSQRDEIEKKFESLEYGSALVDNIAGLGTYPAIVSDHNNLKEIFNTASHEWLHNYWLFHPLGRNMWSSAEMYTINETAANIAGDELGLKSYESLFEEIAETTNIKSKNNDFFFKTMKETRKRTEDLLKDGKISEAENYMEKQRILINAEGYNIRKINQAYFAFRGKYGDSPASNTPIYSQLIELRKNCLSLGDFIKKISQISSYEQFKKQINDL